MAQQIQIRGDTLTAWVAANPTLAERELAVETDTLRFKVGDGLTAWNSLGYIEMSRELERVAVSVVAGTPNTLTLDMELRHERKFEVATAQSAAFTIAFANVTEARFISLTVPITGAIAITFPTNVVAMRNDGRWNNTTKIITANPAGAGDIFEMSFNVLPGPLYVLKISDPYFSS
jgi:hypothetical protein